MKHKKIIIKKWNENKITEEQTWNETRNGFLQEEVKME